MRRTKEEKHIIAALDYEGGGASLCPESDLALFMNFDTGISAKKTNGKRRGRRRERKRDK